MKLLKTEKDILSKDDILKYLSDYESQEIPLLNKLWNYYIGDNQTILSKKAVDANNPDNRIVIPYGRKIVNTFTGYAYRPRYITYKANVEKDLSLEVDNINSDMMMEKSKTKEDQYVDQLKETFNLNNEHIKTSRAGRNIAIFGLSYEVLYIDGVIDEKMSIKAEPKFFTADPREVILLYDYSSEPKKKIGIRFYRISDIWYKVEVYYKDKIELFDRKRDDMDGTKWVLTDDGSYPNFFGEVPIVPFYFGDEMLGVIKPVLPLIDANDTLFSDAMNEEDRFAYAYLIMKKFGITDATKDKDPSIMSRALKNLKRSRVFEHLPSDADIKFLTKDIPTGFFQFMRDSLRDQIHIQAHVPDFTMMTGTLSGAAIQRLLFDFENIVSSAEADFDVGLIERIRLINIIYARTGRPTGTADMITISHKRNVPLNLLEFAQTANLMKTAGFSAYLIADIMPDDIIPDVQAELLRQQKEAEALVGPMDQNQDYGFEDNQEDDETESQRYA